MGYLDNSSITVDAVLTKKGREILKDGKNLNITSFTLSDSGVDYTQDAQSQISKVTVGNNPDPIWDKKFKIRMTSKKTGKKIDVNITYKLRTST